MTSYTKSSEIIENETGAQRLIGYVMDVGNDDGCARCYLIPEVIHLNRHNVLHGRITTTLLDNAMGATASLTVDSSGRAPFMTISLTTHFMTPAAVEHEVRSS